MKLDTKQAQAMRQRHGLKDDADVREINSTLVTEPIAGDPHRFTAVITTDALDRQDEVVLPEGGQFGEFLNSGAIFWNHQYDNPVGFPDKSKRIIRSEHSIEAGGIFMQRPAIWTGEFFPDFVREFVTQGRAAGISPGVSIGFMPLESRRPSKADTQRYGDNVQLVHNRWKLLEFSIAPVQANQEAVVTAVGKGLIKREIAKAIGIKIPDAPPAPPKVVRATLALPPRPKALNVDEIVRREMRREIYRKFGQVFMPS